MPSHSTRWPAFVAAIGLFATVTRAQAPPPELNAFVLIDVGPVKVPVSCSCITAPFKVPESRPGWGFGIGPAAPSDDAALTRAERVRAATLAARGRQTLATDVEDGLAGNPAASVRVAVELTAGALVRRDDEEAARWFHLAAEQGHSDAYIQLGHRYQKGLGVQPNDQAAAHWFSRGASAGDGNAMVALGLLYAAGRGVPQDWAAAVHWWGRARSGSQLAIASRFLGDAYACGLGVPPDPHRAVVAYREAADAGELSSSVQLGHMLASGCAAPDDEAAFSAYKRAADHGDPEAQIALSALYLQGRGTEASPYMAYLWANLAERRLPDGAMRTLAGTRAAVAARFLSPFEIKDCEALVASLVETGRSR